MYQMTLCVIKQRLDGTDYYYYYYWICGISNTTPRRVNTSNCELNFKNQLRNNVLVTSAIYAIRPKIHRIMMLRCSRCGENIQYQYTLLTADSF